jgi:hypothetical protein
MSDQSGCHCYVLDYRAVREQIEILKHHTDFAAHYLNVANVVVQHRAVNHNLTALMLLKAIQGADKS